MLLDIFLERMGYREEVDEKCILITALFYLFRVKVIRQVSHLPLRHTKCFIYLDFRTNMMKEFPF